MGIMVKKALTIFLVATIPLMFIGVVYQSSRYTALRLEAEKLEREQKAWIDSNKKLLTGISVLSAPGRIDGIAREDLKLEKAKPEEIIDVKIGGAE